MSICENWAGNAYGTNTGNLFVTLVPEKENLEGKIHLNDPQFGILVFAVQGSFSGEELTLVGRPERANPGIATGMLNVTGRLLGDGTIRGNWETDVGGAGTLVLFPHENAVIDSANLENEQRSTTVFR